MLKFRTGYFNGSSAFFTKMTFKLCLELVNESSCVTVNCDFFYSSFTRLFPDLDFSHSSFFLIHHSILREQTPEGGKVRETRGDPNRFWI